MPIHSRTDPSKLLGRTGMTKTNTPAMNHVPLHERVQKYRRAVCAEALGRSLLQPERCANSSGQTRTSPARRAGFQHGPEIGPTAVFPGRSPDPPNGRAEHAQPAGPQAWWCSQRCRELCGSRSRQQPGMLDGELDSPSEGKLL